MQFTSIDDFAEQGPKALPRGPVALILCENEVLLTETIRHYLDHGFGAVVLFAPSAVPPPANLDTAAFWVTHNDYGEAALSGIINALMAPLSGRWVYCGYNAEFLYYPFCETRSVGELLEFHSQERRNAMLCHTVDLYAGDLSEAPDAVDFDAPWMDSTGYYAQPREDAENNYIPLDRQIDCYGGLRRRYEEHVPWERRRIDRIALFQAKAGLVMASDFTLNDAEMNTYACKWHNNVTAVVASFRTARALLDNPGSRAAIQTFQWERAVRFDGTSQQLMTLGLMEPGQWF